MHALKAVLPVALVHKGQRCKNGRAVEGEREVEEEQMNQQQHIINATCIMCALLIARPSYFIWAIPLGALLPDLDQHAQKLTHYWLHRKLLHNMFVPFLIICFGYSTGIQEFTLFLAIGVIAHLLADSISKGKTYFLWPLHGFHTGGGISFSRPQGGKTMIKKLNNQIKSAVSETVVLMQIRGFCRFCNKISSDYAFRGLECVF